MTTPTHGSSSGWPRSRWISASAAVTLPGLISITSCEPFTIDAERSTSSSVGGREPT